MVKQIFSSAMVIALLEDVNKESKRGEESEYRTNCGQAYQRMSTQLGETYVDLPVTREQVGKKVNNIKRTQLDGLFTENPNVFFERGCETVDVRYLRKLQGEVGRTNIFGCDDRKVTSSPRNHDRTKKPIGVKLEQQVSMSKRIIINVPDDSESTDHDSKEVSGDDGSSYRDSTDRSPTSDLEPPTSGRLNRQPTYKANLTYVSSKNDKDKHHEAIATLSDDRGAQLRQVAGTSESSDATLSQIASDRAQTLTDYLHKNTDTDIVSPDELRKDYARICEDVFRSHNTLLGLDDGSQHDSQHSQVEPDGPIRILKALRKDESLLEVCRVIYGRHSLQEILSCIAGSRPSLSNCVTALLGAAIHLWVFKQTNLSSELEPKGAISRGFEEVKDARPELYAVAIQKANQRFFSGKNAKVENKAFLLAHQFLEMVEPVLALNNIRIRHAVIDTQKQLAEVFRSSIMLAERAKLVGRSVTFQWPAFKHKFDPEKMTLHKKAKSEAEKVHLGIASALLERNSGSEGGNVNVLLPGRVILEDPLPDVEKSATASKRPETQLTTDSSPIPQGKKGEHKSESEKAHATQCQKRKKEGESDKPAKSLRKQGGTSARSRPEAGT